MGCTLQSIVARASRNFEKSSSLFLAVSYQLLVFLLKMPRRRRRRLRTAEPELHHNVYVILLSKAALKDESVLRRNPKRNPKKPAVYVGLTGLPVDHRFENHK